MCGIVGIIGHNTTVSADMLEQATRSLAHRGPDDHGTTLIRETQPHPVEVGLGNRRLAILDLSPLGHQPMQDAATGNWIVYNGEIYNFREIRKELERAGISFLSNSDTEVLLKAYAAWGAQCLPKLRGMFAFAIWDARLHRLFAARDPMGIKPFYYAQRGGYFLFASEVRTLLGTGLVPALLDPAGVLNYLSFGSACDPITLIEGVSSLPAGHSLVWERGTISQSSYWNLIDEEAARSSGIQSRSEAIAALRPVLSETVRQQLVSDVPVGIFLSGGIDSSALVSIVSRSGTTPSTFSIVFREAEFSEAEHSRAVARHFQTDHHEIIVSQADVLASIPDAIAAMDLPTMDGINSFFVSRETRRAGVKVALSGLGGDELFAGYSTFRSVPRMQRLVRILNFFPRPLRAFIASAFSALAPSNDQNRKLTALARDTGRLGHPYFLARMLFTPAQTDFLLKQATRNIDAYSARQKEILDLSEQMDAVNRVSYFESQFYMLNTLLRDTDFMSMSQGLEVRVPLIDHRLASMVLAMPGFWKLNDSTPKNLLVGALESPLPDAIIHRQKQGFTLPFKHWMRDEIRPELEQALSEKKIGDGPLGETLNPQQVEKVWKDFLNRKISWSRPWSLYVLQRWCELHSVTMQNSCAENPAA